MRLRHIAIEVSDLERAIDFYEKLGFKEKREQNLNHISTRLVFLGLPEDEIEIELIFSSVKKGRSTNKSTFHIGIEVNDLDRVFGELKDKGIRFDSEPVSVFGGLRIAFLSDPDGNQVELYSKR